MLTKVATAKKSSSLSSTVRRAGFTLLEMLVVIGITTLLSALAIVYSHSGQNEVSLTVETSKIAELILEAKELSVATYKGADNSCAYGMQFDFKDQTYSLFAYGLSGTSDCLSLASTTALGITPTDLPSPILEYSPSTWQVPLAQGLVMGDSSRIDNLYDVLFYPPAPTTLLSNDGATFMQPAQTLNVYLQTADGQGMSKISVSPAGQVTF